MRAPVRGGSVAAIVIGLISTSFALASPASSEADRLAGDGNFKAAAAALERAQEQAPDDLDVLLGLAKCESRLGHAEAAVKWAEAATRRAPDSALAWTTLADALSDYVDRVGTLRKLGVARRIRDAYEKAVEVAPADPRTLLAAALFHMIAPGIAGGSTSRGEEELARLERIAPGMAALARARLASRAKDDAEAERQLRLAAQAHSEAEGAVALANWLAAHGRFDEAVSELRSAAAAHPAETAPHYQLGRLAAAGHGDAGAGIRALEATLALPADWRRGDPPRSWVHYRLGQLLATQGDSARAREEFEHALELDPSFTKAREALGQLPKAS